MTIFAVTYTYSDDTATRDAVRPSHREYLRSLAEQGELLVSGPYGSAEAPGALLVFRAETADRVAELVGKDPFSTAGVVVASTITAWEPVIGPLAAGFTAG